MPQKSLLTCAQKRRRASAAAAVVAGAGALLGAGSAAPTAGARLIPVVGGRPAQVKPGPLAGELATGARGADVRILQRALAVPVSGRYRASTRLAVVRFQRRHHLQVDGITGPQTWDTLFHIRQTRTTAAVSSADASSGFSIPSSIVMCESGGNYSAVNASSGAGGAYQILPSTWQAYGGQGLPQDASPAEQNAIAQRIYAAQGASAWSC